VLQGLVRRAKTCDAETCELQAETTISGVILTESIFFQTCLRFSSLFHMLRNAVLIFFYCFFSSLSTYVCTEEVVDMDLRGRNQQILLRHVGKV